MSDWPFSLSFFSRKGMIQVAFSFKNVKKWYMTNGCGYWVPSLFVFHSKPRYGWSPVQFPKVQIIISPYSKHSFSMTPTIELHSVFLRLELALNFAKSGFWSAPKKMRVIRADISKYWVPSLKRSQIMPGKWLYRLNSSQRHTRRMLGRAVAHIAFILVRQQEQSQNVCFRHKTPISYKTWTLNHVWQITMLLHFSRPDCGRNVKQTYFRTCHK